MPGGSRGGETTAYCLISFLASNTAEVLADGRVSLDSRETAQVLRFLRSFIDDGLMSPTSSPTSGIARSGSWPRARRRSASGGATRPRRWRPPSASRCASSGITSASRRSRRSQAVHPASVAGTMVYGIFRQAAQPALAMRLLEGLVAPESLARIAGATGRIPSRRSAVALAAPELAFLSQTADLLDHAVTRPSTPLYPRVSAQLQAMLEAVLTGRLGPAAAAQRAAQLIAAITGSRSSTAPSRRSRPRGAGRPRGRRPFDGRGEQSYREPRPARACGRREGRSGERGGRSSAGLVGSVSTPPGSAWACDAHVVEHRRVTMVALRPRARAGGPGLRAALMDASLARWRRVRDRRPVRLRGVELSVAEPGCARTTGTCSATGSETARSRSTRSCSASTTTAGSLTPIPRSPAAAEDVRLAVARAAELGADVVLVPFFLRGELVGEDAFDRCAVAFASLCPVAAARGVTLCFEGLLPAREIRHLAERVGSSGFGCYFDLANPLRRGLDSPTELRALGGLIRRVHVKELRVAPGDVRPGGAGRLRRMRPRARRDRL